MDQQRKVQEKQELRRLVALAQAADSLLMAEEIRICNFKNKQKKSANLL